MFVSLLLWIGVIASATAAPSPIYVQHEKRYLVPQGWQKAERLNAADKLPMRIALTQPNLKDGYQHIMDVSHPDSPNFGKHWSAKKVAETFAPKQESVDAVLEWLQGAGISPDRVSRSQSLGWLQFDASALEAESLLRTKYHMHRHETGKPHIACDSYHIPQHLQPHIDFITPTIHFDTKIPQANIKRQETTSSTAAAGVPVRTKAALQVGKPYQDGSLPKKGADINIGEILDELRTCNTHITPNCLRALYRFPPNFAAARGNSFGIVEYTPQSFLQNDLDLFFANFSTRQRQKTPDTKLIDGAIVQITQQGFAFNAESDLDLEYAMALVNPQNVTLYQAGDLVEGASFNNFLDAIDGEYCTFDGGDDPLQDATFPDNATGGYKGPRNCGGFASTKVISTSYAYNEADLTAKYEQRQCAEYMKLGLQGTSFFFSSGDYGVAGNGGQCISNITTNSTSNATVLNDGRSGKFNPSFPSTCPFVTSVGATQIVPGGAVTDPEEACETTIFSGGGFSNVFPLPQYQSTAVSNYFGNYNLTYGASQFNNSRHTRGFPDISANGANYVTAVDGAFTLIFGTSASTPVVGSIFTLINEARFALGKGSIGFVNPTLYAHPEDLNDITKGGNQGCGTPGFESVAGWDPVTGLGTPNFPRLLARFLSLP
ncbi:uncharacterized protein KY384_004058 [Bacidia gigantensis]|uniref:uncharacterized protein n=1 Tax=Bacidia gigantensis TaxID=2732470 RepID=UPI001D059EFA|nr:uncharacterized protein KY384_004058 [Bacidia gigantensis]KAG8530702.1 hypothetical protein KY384_004058 [Bacidia gigantensis]